MVEVVSTAAADGCRAGSAARAAAPALATARGVIAGVIAEWAKVAVILQRDVDQASVDLNAKQVRLDGLDFDDLGGVALTVSV